MKNITTLIVVVTILLSCKRNYECECSFDQDAGKRAYMSEEMTKKKAGDWCSAIEDDTEVGYLCHCENFWTGEIDSSFVIVGTLLNAEIAATNAEINNPGKDYSCYVQGTTIVEINECTLGE
mgnify:CR=1 FL=1